MTVDRLSRNSVAVEALLLAKRGVAGRLHVTFDSERQLMEQAGRASHDTSVYACSCLRE